MNFARFLEILCVQWLLQFYKTDAFVASSRVGFIGKLERQNDPSFLAKRSQPKRNLLQASQHSDSEYVYDHPKTPFKLWIESEVWSSQDEFDPTDEFCNVSVDTMDGRSFGINTWTYECVHSIAASTIEDGSSDRGLYESAPDLLVKELTRPCIEFAIADLLRKGDLDVYLNPTVFGIRFLPPWEEIDLDDAEKWPKTRIEKLEHEAAMILDTKPKRICLEASHIDTGEICFSSFDSNEFYTTSVCPEIGSLMAGAEHVRKYVNEKQFWTERLGPDIQARKAELN